MSLPDVSIIVASWNTRELLAACLRSVAQEDIGAEVLVVDNASTDGSPEMLRREFGYVHLVANEENLGFARANNQGLRASRGRHVLLLNSDTVVQPGALGAMIRFMDGHSRVGVCGPELLNVDGTLQQSWASFPSLWSELSGKLVRRRRPYPTQDGRLAYEVDWIGGACLLMRRATFEAVGPLDERFFMYSEETDWCFRARERGWTICYYPEARVVHLGGASTRLSGTAMKAQLYRSKLLFFQKHYGRDRSRQLARLLRCRLLVKALLGRSLSVVTLNCSSLGRAAYEEAHGLLTSLEPELRGRDAP